MEAAFISAPCAHPACLLFNVCSLNGCVPTRSSGIMSRCVASVVRLLSPKDAARAVVRRGESQLVPIRVAHPYYQLYHASTLLCVSFAPKAFDPCEPGSRDGMLGRKYRFRSLLPQGEAHRPKTCFQLVERNLRYPTTERCGEDHSAFAWIYSLFRGFGRYPITSF